jgi:pilus assembly protein CpaB
MAKVSSGTMTVTVFAALVGLGGAFVVRQTMQRPTPVEATTPATAAPAPVFVPLAAMDLQPGRKLTLNDIAPRRLTQEEFKKSEYRKVTFLSSTTQIQGRSLRKAVSAGRPFQPDDFFPDGAGPDIAERLQAGYRAVTVPIESVGSVNGFAVPGSIVDVLFRAKPEGVRPAVTLTLLERIEVLAFNVNTTQGMRDPAITPVNQATVTLAVTPQQAKILKVVEGRGDMSLTLRNPKDDFQFAPVEVGGGMRPDLMRRTNDLVPTPDDEFQTVQSRHPNAVRNSDKVPTSDTAQASDVTANLKAKATANSNAAQKQTGSLPTKLVVDDQADDDQIAAALVGAIAKADREVAADGHVDRFVGNASERLTLDDLLGIKPAPKKRTMEVFMGASRRVLNFDDNQQDVNADTPIRTPVVGTQPALAPNMNTAQTQFQR